MDYDKHLDRLTEEHLHDAVCADCDEPLPFGIDTNYCRECMERIAEDLAESRENN